MRVPNSKSLLVIISPVDAPSPLGMPLPPGDYPRSVTYPSDISHSSYHFVNATLLKLILGSIAGLDLNLSTFSLLANQLDPNWGIRVGDFTQLKMNYNDEKAMAIKFVIYLPCQTVAHIRFL